MKNLKYLFGLLFATFFFFSSFSQTSTFSKEEKSNIIFLLEEEKLAKDVYLNLEEKWGTQIFGNISQAEIKHQSMMELLSVSAGMDLPESVTSNRQGIFQNAELQKKYNDMIQLGAQSKANALKVGATIEEMDISDLSLAIFNTSNPSLIETYTRLKNASGHHLNAFVKNLKKEGIQYSPQILDKNEFDNIINDQAKSNACCSNEGSTTACSGNHKNENSSKGMGIGKNDKASNEAKACCGKCAKKTNNK